MQIVADDAHQDFWGLELSDGEYGPSWEHPGRAEVVDAELERRGYPQALRPEPFDAADAAEVHDPDYLEFLRTAWDRWVALGRTSPAAIGYGFPMRRGTPRVPQDVEGQLGYYAFAVDCSITAATWRAATGSAASAITAARLLAGGADSAFARCRPPGHHAGIDYFGGYCYLNNTALAANTLRRSGANRVAILDVDYHHGNGTQDIFYRRSDVVTISIHADPVHQFPWFCGFADEVGAGQGEGANHNLPLPRGCSADRWMQALEVALTHSGGADALVVALGVDTYVEDPISDFALTNADFVALGDRIAQHTTVPTMFVMEGGYAPRQPDTVGAIGTNVVNVLDGFNQRRD